MSSVNTSASPLDGEPVSEADARCKLMSRYLSLFPSRFQSGMKREAESAWKFMSKYHTLADVEVEQLVDNNKGNVFRAFAVEPSAYYLVVSISAKSAYLSANFVTNIRSALKARGITSCLYEFQGDWFIFIYFSQQIDTSEFCSLFKNWCDSLGMKTGKDGICIHEPDSLVPFPLQSGFFWLNDRCQKLVKRDELSLEKAIAFFIQDAAQKRNDGETFRSTFKISVLSSKSRIFGSSSIVKSEAEPSAEHDSASTAQVQIAPPSSQVEDSEASPLGGSDTADVSKISAEDNSVIADAVQVATSTEGPTLKLVPRAS